MQNIPAVQENSVPIQGLIFTIAVLLGFSIVVAWRLLTGSIAPSQGSLWLGVACLCPIGWYGYGYLRTNDNRQSNALLMNAIGWAFVAAGFLVHYKEMLEADPGTPLSAISTALVIILSLAGLFILVAGGLLSWTAITKPQTLDTEHTP